MSTALDASALSPKLNVSRATGNSSTHRQPKPLFVIAESASQFQPMAWWIFGVIVLGLLIVDLWVTQHAARVSRKHALTWTIIWICTGLLFGVYVWVAFGSRHAHEYFAAYLIEKSLSLDNIFVFLLIFNSLGVEKKDQHKVLLWGIFGAIVTRAVFILVGTAALDRWQWVSYVFAALLLYAAWHAFREDPAKQKESKLVDWLSKHLPVTKKTENGQFVEEARGRFVVTPLLLALIAIELSDVMFAIDSVPAALSMTRNPFIVYSSNIFAILGLRALYLLLSQWLVELPYLHYGLAAVLGFAALKMAGDEWLHISPLVSVAIIVAILGVSISVSLHARRGKSKKQVTGHPRKSEPMSAR